MKINTTKLVVGVLAVAGVASLVGSISGTVAWFQYNTRAVAEFEGTSAKCSEFLEVRTVKKGLPIKAADATVPTSGMTKGERYLNTTDGKIYTATSATAVDTGETADITRIYGTADKLYKYDSTSSAWVVDSDVYGEWKTAVSNTDILNATGRADGGLAPVTLPFASDATDLQNALIDGSTNKFYGHPIAGYELYKETTTNPYHWDVADAADYMKFQLQFRVLDVDGLGVAAGKEALLAKDLWLTDLTIQKKGTDTTKNDLSSAVRVHVSDGTTGSILAYGEATTDGSKSTVDTVTKGQLDLNLDKVLDNSKDVPGAHYSFTEGTSPTTLEYGSDLPQQKAYNVRSQTVTGSTVTSSIYPTNDGVGHLSGGRVLGTTGDNPSGTDETAWLTLTFTIWLEGWAKIPGSTNLGEVGASNSIWDIEKAIGSEFNIGMSFAVSALD